MSRYLIAAALFAAAPALLAQPALDAYGNPVPYWPATAPADDFALLTRINMASAVMLAETRIVPAEVAGRLARGIVKVGEANAARRRDASRSSEAASA